MTDYPALAALGVTVWTLDGEYAAAEKFDGVVIPAQELADT